MVPREVNGEMPQPAMLVDSAKMQELEQRYIRLLEERCAKLEALLGEKGNGSKTEKKDEKDEKDKSKDKKDEDGTKTEDGKEKKARVRNVVSKWNYTDDNRQDYERTDAIASKETEQITTFRRFMDGDNEKKLLYEEVDVQSPALRKLLAETLDHCPPQQFDAEHVYFISPFQQFVWQWEKLQAATAPQPSDSLETKNAREDLGQLLPLVQTSDKLDSYFKTQLSHLAGQTMTYKFIWTLYKPGTRVYARSFLNEYQMFEVQQSAYADDQRFFKIFCAAFDWDGTHFTRRTYAFRIKKFDGSQSVANLICFPVEYYQNDAGESGDRDLRKRLIERGRKFCKLCTEEDVQYDYEGPVMHIGGGLVRPKAVHTDDDPQLVDDEFLERVSKTTQCKRSKVIIDNFSFIRSGRNPNNGLLPLGTANSFDGTHIECPCAKCRHLVTQQWVGKLHDSENDELEKFMAVDDHMLMCPPKMLGYSLHLKVWCQFMVDKVEKIERNVMRKQEDFFETKLELNEDNKKLLKAFINNHQSAKENRPVTDIIEGKGQGLVILLHGPPGVGKTLTAETVALATGKPLLPISVAEISIEPDKAEKNLVEIFADAGRWEAVLLIDEADVFLEERKGTHEAARNALVSVLLRVLEYYEGIIILTTNRITSLDVAVQSRIHLAIQYQDLQEEQKKKIFKYFLDQIGDKHIYNRNDIDKKLFKICKKKINGRQIRNIVSSARALAQDEDDKLRFQHLETVTEATLEFLECLKDMTNVKRGQNEAPLL